MKRNETYGERRTRLEETYQVSIVCPHCGKKLTGEKKKNGSSVHDFRIVLHAKHRNSGECKGRAI